MQELRGSHPALAWAGAGVWGAEGAGGGPGRHRTPTGHVDGGGALRRLGRRCPLAPEGARDGRSGRAACCPCPPHPLGLPRSGDTSLLPPWPPALSPSVSPALARPHPGVGGVFRPPWPPPLHSCVWNNDRFTASARCTCAGSATCGARRGGPGKGSEGPSGASP